MYQIFIKTNFLEYFNPLHYFTYEQYINFWKVLFQTVLSGFWARALSASSLFLAFWFMARRQNIPLFIFFMSIAFITAYLGGIINLLMG